MTNADAARTLAHADCLRPENRFGAAFFEEHLQLVVQHALRLAGPLGADREVVELAGWLHDLAAVRDFSCLPTHAADGARLAAAWLGERGAPPATVEAVRRSVASHSAPVAPGAGTLEEVCLSNADVLAQLSRPAYWFHYLYGVRGLTREAGLAWFRGRAVDAWAALTPEAQAMGAAEREVVLRLLQAPGGEAGTSPQRPLTPPAG
jgi:uncharacterized protein